jgi:hypothetical protein
METNAGIVTLCDANYFPGLLMLHQSVQESDPCGVVCYDAGLTDAQRLFAKTLENLQVLPLPDDPLIARIEEEMGQAPSLGKLNKRVWPLWICPLLIKHAPFRDVFWMDCDLVVLRGLRELFALLASGPVFTPENKAPHLTPNHPELYQLLPIHRIYDPLIPTINAGVSGWRKDRDAAAIDAYIYPIERALGDRNVRDAISWHDQGALIWAIQACGLEHRVAATTAWNLCVDHTSVAQRPIPWNEDFLDAVRAEVPQANVLHWNGCKPPWAEV